MIEFLTALDPTVLVAFLTVLGTVIGGWRMGVQKKKEREMIKQGEDERAFQKLASDLVQSNVINLTTQITALLGRISELEANRDGNDDSLDDVRKDAFELRLKILSFKSMIDSIAFSAERLYSLHGSLTPGQFAEALQSHVDHIRKTVSLLEDDEA